MLARHCLALVRLDVTLEVEALVGDIVKIPLPSRAQVKDSETNDTYSNLKVLSIERYGPKHLYAEFMYLKKKFGNLERLVISRREHGLLHRIPTKQEVEEIVSYIFTIKSFDIGILCPVSLDIVKNFYDAYCTYSKLVNVSIYVTNGLMKKGVCMDRKESNLKFWYDTTGVVDSEEELNNILHVGQHTQKWNIARKTVMFSMVQPKNNSTL